MTALDSDSDQDHVQNVEVQKEIDYKMHLDAELDNADLDYAELIQRCQVLHYFYQNVFIVSEGRPR